MIDTSKYENHDMIRIAKQLLIEDAPLLLEEVKRLRKAIIEVAFDKHESVYEMKQALVKNCFERLKEAGV